MEDLAPGTLAAIGGLIAGIGLGFGARWGNFCTLGAIEDALFGGNLDRARMWLLIIAIAIAGTFAIDHLGLIDITTSFYLATTTTLIATAAGSVIFGLGMSLVGTCGFGALVRIGGGDLKSVVTFFIMGISAYATMHGASAYLRLAFFPLKEQDERPAGFAHLVADNFPGSPNIWAYAIAICIFIAAIYPVNFRDQPKRIIAALIIGLMIVWGWISTGYIAPNEYETHRLESLTFSAPLGETLIYVMTMTGSTLKFGIGATTGVIIGAAITAFAQGHFRWEAVEDPREFRRQLIGGILMGTGGVTALGCTIGQGVSAFSTLAFSAPVALIGIFCGAWLGLNLLIHGTISEAFHNLRFLNREQ